MRHCRLLYSYLCIFGPIIELFTFHATILKPDFDLALGESKPTGDLPSFLSCYVRIVYEFGLEHHCLVTCVWFALLAR